MKIIGKIVIFFLITTWAYCATVELSSTQVASGEQVAFSIITNGKDVEFPDIKEVDGYKVRGGGVSKRRNAQVYVQNGKMTKKSEFIQVKTYIFYPEKSLTLPSFNVKVDGETQKTNEVPIEVVSVDELNKKIPYKISLKMDTNSSYIGEMLKLSLILKLDERLNIYDLKLNAGEMDGFWMEKDMTKSSQKKESGYVIFTQDYYISPLKTGELKIEPFEVGLGFETGAIFDPVRYRYIRSKPLKVNVKPLPSGVQAVGEDFSIKARVDGDNLEDKKAVNLDIVIEGKGSLKNIDRFKPKIDGVVVYDDKPVVKADVREGEFKSVFTQKLALVGQKDFTIPPFSFSYLDTKTNSIKTIKTEPINIKVKGSKSKEKIRKSEMSSSQNTTQENQKELVVYKANLAYVFLAFVCGLGLGLLLKDFEFRKLLPQKSVLKSNKELLRELLIYQGKNEKLDEIIKKLEQNIYANQKHKIDRKEIKRLKRELLFS